MFKTKNANKIDNVGVINKPGKWTSIKEILIWENCLKHSSIKTEQHLIEEWKRYSLSDHLMHKKYDNSTQPFKKEVRGQYLDNHITITICILLDMYQQLSH